MFKISSIEIKSPSEFKVERYNITTLERLSNADMVGDLVAKKYKFYFTYESLTAVELETILAAIWYTEELFFTLDYPYNGEMRTASVYAGSIPTDLHRASGKNWVWKNVQFNLIER